MKKLLLLCALAACSNPVEPDTTKVEVPMFAKSASAGSCHRSSQHFRCIAIWTGAMFVTVMVPFTCTSWVACGGAVVGAGFAWDTFGQIDNPGHEPWSDPPKEDDPWK